MYGLFFNCSCSNAHIPSLFDHRLNHPSLLIVDHHQASWQDLSSLTCARHQTGSAPSFTEPTHHLHLYTTPVLQWVASSKSAIISPSAWARSPSRGRGKARSNMQSHTTRSNCKFNFFPISDQVDLGGGSSQFVLDGRLASWSKLFYRKPIFQYSIN